MMYALLPNKAQESYGRLFALISHLKPKTVISDFEVAITKAAEIQFSNIKIQYCFFHMGQSVFRKIVEIGCKVRYVEDKTFRHHCKLIMSLAFIHPEDVEEGYKCIEASFEDEEFDKILDYLEENYIGRIVRGKRRAPRFAILKWNCFPVFRNSKIQRIILSRPSTMLVPNQAKMQIADTRACFRLLNYWKKSKKWQKWNLSDWCRENLRNRGRIPSKLLKNF